MAAQREKKPQPGRRRKRPPNRPTVRTAATARKVIRAISDGLSKDDAARAAGIAPSTLFDWLAADQDFSDRVTRARDQLKPKLVGFISNSATKDWRAAAWLLERYFRDEFGKTVTLEGGDPEKPVPIALRIEGEIVEAARRLAGRSPAELDALIKAGGLSDGEPASKLTS